MYGITDLRKGTLIELDGSIYRVVDYSHSSVARGGGVVRTKLKNVEDGSTLSKTFKGSDKITPAELTKIDAEYLYSDQESVYFLRLDNYEQISMPRDMAEHELGFMKEGFEVSLLYSDERLIGIELPIKVDLEVVSAEPGIKGDSASNITKNCQVETGRTVSVPLFVEKEDVIRVDTRDGSYVERLS